METSDSSKIMEGCREPESKTGHYFMTKIKNLIDVAQIENMGVMDFISGVERIVYEPDGETNHKQLCHEKEGKHFDPDDMSDPPNDENECVDSSDFDVYTAISTPTQTPQAASQLASATTEQFIELINSIINPEKVTKIRERDVVELENVMGNLYQYSEVLDGLPKRLPFPDVISAHFEAREKLKDFISEKRRLVLEEIQKKLHNSRKAPRHLSEKKSFFKITVNGKCQIIEPNIEKLPKNSHAEASNLEIHNPIKSHEPFLDSIFLANNECKHEKPQNQEIAILKSRIKELEQKLEISERKLEKIGVLLKSSNFTESTEINFNLTKNENLGETPSLITEGASDETQSPDQILDSIVHEDMGNSGNLTSDGIFEIDQDTEVPITDLNEDIANSSASAQIVLRSTPTEFDSSTTISDFTYEEKLEICRQLELLPGPEIKSFTKWLCLEEPNLKWTEDGDLNIDFLVLKPSTLVFIKNFLSACQIDSLKQLRNGKLVQNSKKRQSDTISEKIAKSEIQKSGTSRNVTNKKVAKSERVAADIQTKSTLKRQQASISRKSKSIKLSNPQRMAKGNRSTKFAKSLVKTRSKGGSATKPFSGYKPGSIKWKLLKDSPVKDEDKTYKCFWPTDCKYQKIGMMGPSKIKKHYIKHVNDEKAEEKTGDIYYCSDCNRHYRHRKSYLYHLSKNHSETHDTEKFL